LKEATGVEEGNCEEESEKWLVAGEFLLPLSLVGFRQQATQCFPKATQLSLLNCVLSHD
jgi:hypothetical protein